MANTLYVTATERRIGKSAVILGLMELLTRNIKRVAFFRPLVDADHGRHEYDNTIELIRRQYGLTFEYEEMYAFTADEANTLISMGRDDELHEKILNKFNALAVRSDFVLIDGLEMTGATSSFDFDLNTDIANNLAAPILLVTDGRNVQADDIRRSVKVYYESLEEKSSSVVGAIVNRVDPTSLEKVGTALKNDPLVGKQSVYVISHDENLGNPSVGEVVRLVNAEVLYGQDKLTRHVRGFTIASMQLRNYLERIEYGNLIIAAGDRSDIILGSLAAVESKSMPNISGIMLTGGLVPEPSVQKVIEGFPDLVPIISVAENTYQAAIRVDSIHATITPDNSRKINEALALFERHVDMVELRDKIITRKTTTVTPKMFESRLLLRAQSDKQHIVLPEGEDDRILQAAEILLRRNVVNLTILGNETKIGERVKSLGLHLDGADIVDPVKSPQFDEYVDGYYELRKHKGISREFATDTVGDFNYFATMMIYKGHADGMVSGAAHTTANTIRPAFQIIKTVPDCSIVSSVFFMCLNDRVLAYGDCAVNPNPNAAELAEIATSSALTAKLFGIEPRVAMLSYSSGNSGKGEQVDKVREATELARERAERLYPGLPIEGPIQYDAAIDPYVGASKMPGSKVAGRATVFIFPDLNTGNNTYKAVQRSSGAVAIGPLLQGLRKPVNDLSRGCLVTDIVNTVAMTAVQAQALK